MSWKGTCGRWLLLLALGMLTANLAQASVFPLGGADDLRLAGNRFQVVASFTTAGGLSGAGHAIPLTANTGAFWFFSPGNVEILVKVLDACTPFGRFWVFTTGLTDVAVTVTVTDFSTGKTQTYVNAQGQAFLPAQDADSFAGCPDPTPHACGQGSVDEITATPRADESAERLALILGGGLTAQPWLYNRVAADLGSIRAQQPDLLNVGFLPKVGTSSLLLSFPDSIYAQIQAGTYHAWDCLNDWYTASIRRLDTASAVLLTVPGIYDMRRVKPEYDHLPGASVELDGYFFLDPYDAGSFCAVVDGPTVRYYARPNDPAAVYYFTSQPGAAPIRQGSYTSAPGEPEPPWLADAADCFQQEVAGCCAFS